MDVHGNSRGSRAGTVVELLSGTPILIGLDADVRYHCGDNFEIF